MSVKIGFIGTGSNARGHMESLLSINYVNVVSIYDVNPEAARQAAELTGAEVKSNADEVLNPSQIDAVFICTPPFARQDLEEIAARRGIHLFVEKPQGLQLDVVRKKADVIRESGIINSVGYVLRYYDTVQQLKAYLQHRHVHLIQADRYGTRHSSAWWWKQDMSGGHLVDAVTHQVDLIRYLVGEYQDVQALFGRTTLHKIKPEATITDAGAISFSLTSGAVGTLTESVVSPHHRGSVIKLFGADFFVLMEKGGKMITIVDENGETTSTATVNPTLEQDRAFIDAVSAGSQDRICCSYTDAMRTLMFTLAAHDSASERKIIRLNS